MVCVTDDLGRTWATTQFVDDVQPDRGHPFTGGRLPVLAQDGEGTLHVVFVATVGKELRVCSSRDGRTWTDPVQLSASDADDVRFPAIAAGGQLVHVMCGEHKLASTPRCKANLMTRKQHPFRTPIITDAC